jgi:ethanolamine utilization protein EutA
MVLVSKAPRDEMPASGHRLADHALGLGLDHVHDSESDHDHDHFGDGGGPIEENPIWIADHVTLNSVGVDIGSAGTQVIFSRLGLRRFGEELTSRYTVVVRETLYLSPNVFTPFLSDTRIDEEQIARIVERAYAAAGLAPCDVDAGAVILTGEALRRENAQAIAEVLARHGGDFVCATAGHHMEAMLAAYGSGAAKASHERGQRILNIDIGGGTTKLALCEAGRVLATAALAIGGRLIVGDAEGRVTRLDPNGALHARRAGIAPDAAGGAAAREQVGEAMAEALVRALGEAPPAEIAALFLTDPLPSLEGVAGVMVSGGVGEYVYGREARDFGDLGRALGWALARRLDARALPWPLLPAGECIRATAVGAAEYSVQLSGNTCHLSDPASLLPRRNLAAYAPPLDLSGAIEAGLVAAEVRAHLAAFGAGEEPFALALAWRGTPEFSRLAALAAGLASALAPQIARAQPIFLVLDGDVAQTLGALLVEEHGVSGPLAVLDGLYLRDFDYLDLGRIRLPSRTVPVTIKSLVFQGDRAPEARRQRHHDHHHHHHGDGHHLHHHPGKAA